MRKLFLFFIFVASCLSVEAQSLKFGVKTGMGFGYNGKISELNETAQTIWKNSGDNNIGWHAGVFTRLSFANFYLQPELYYSNFKSDFVDSQNNSFDIKNQRLDIPILIGTKIIKILRVNAGPVFSANIKDRASELKNISSGDFSIGGQLGTGIDLFNFTFDARYEFAFSKAEGKFFNQVTGNSVRYDKRPSMLVLSIGYIF